MLVSFVIPVYKPESDSLKKCVVSCLDQTYQNIEVILILNGTSEDEDNMVRNLFNLCSNVKIYKSKEKGVSIARNLGIRLAKGGWISFVDSDDWIEKEFCSKLLNVSNIFNFDLVCCGYYKDFSNKQDIFRIQNEGIHSSKSYKNDIFQLKNGAGLVWGKLWKRDFLVHNKLTFNQDLEVAEDACFTLQACEFSPKVLYVNEVLYHYTVSSQSTVRMYNPMYSSKYIHSMEVITKYSGLDNKNIYNFITYHLLLICVNDVFNINNKIGYKERIKKLRSLLMNDIFYDSLYKCNARLFALPYRITTYVLRLRLYRLLSFICTYRQKQR